MPEQSHAIDHNGGHTLLPAYIGEFGGQYVPELLIPALDQLERAFDEAMNDQASAKNSPDTSVTTWDDLPRSPNAPTFRCPAKARGTLVSS